MVSEQKANVLLVGVGGIGTICALNLERGGRATVTAVLRSNYDHVAEHGFNIRSIDHGVVKGFKPTISEFKQIACMLLRTRLMSEHCLTVLKTIPDVDRDNLASFKYIICTTKNIPDIPPSVADIIKPAVTPGYTVIVLMQNGLNIEKPVIEAFPHNVILSSVTFCGSHQVKLGEINHDDNDRSSIGAFRNKNLDPDHEDREAQQFCDIYQASGKAVAEFQPDVGFSRWRKLLYNACLNSICAVTDLDTGRIQIADGAIELLVKPAMEEIRAAAKACGHDLPAELVDFMITMDPITMYNPPSMQVDMRNVSSRSRDRPSQSLSTRTFVYADFSIFRVASQSLRISLENLFAKEQNEVCRCPPSQLCTAF